MHGEKQKGAVEQERERERGRGSRTEEYREEERYREAKKITAVWEREGARGGTETQRRGDRASRAQNSPQLSLSALPEEFVSSDTSFSCSPPFLFCNSGRLAVLHLREYVGVSQLL